MRGGDFQGAGAKGERELRTKLGAGARNPAFGKRSRAPTTRIEGRRKKSGNRKRERKTGTARLSGDSVDRNRGALTGPPIRAMETRIALRMLEPVPAYPQVLASRPKREPEIPMAPEQLPVELTEYEPLASNTLTAHPTGEPAFPPYISRTRQHAGPYRTPCSTAP
jgi:hypothetical protein